ncbi:Ctf8-domain-containing protein [Chaetomium tenue]|uniref:Ctf8-domain-containing protein n=1 Tax=Chaetomium tenue TaxID=1854479 RepID=A0ACB7NXD7_9PEZI|nr:Ctf8-domain-containing protein [Chaetomium globosum]
MSTTTQPIPLHPRPSPTTTSTTTPPQPPPQNPLPTLLQTPSGLALLELQGTINLPPTPFTPSQASSPPPVPIGRLLFPDYIPGGDSTAWMKRAWLFVGENQRLQGEVKKLPRAVAVLRRRGGRGVEGGDGDGDVNGEELEVVEVVKYKVVFSSRPEPVGSEEVVA